MSFFLGLFPDQNSNHSIESVAEETKAVFEGFDIPVRWSKSVSYHLTIVHLGESVPFYKMLFLKYKIKRFNFKQFKIKFNTIKLGISRKYKELIYLDLLEGGDDMRRLLLELRKVLGIKNEGNFLPHLTLGRVSKELTDQEYSNICRDLSAVAKRLDIEKIEFLANDFKLVKSTDDNYQILMNLRDCSNI